MNPVQVLWPMFALATWTFVVLLRVPYKRLSAGRAGRVTAEDFRYGESDRVPPDVRIPNRNFMNLLELPVLFYVGCLTAYVTRQAGALTLALAWAYVALRIVHSLVHLSYNKVFHRLAVYALSNMALGLLWLHLLVSLA
jgi:hypothetical protein